MPAKLFISIKNPGKQEKALLGFDIKSHQRVVVETAVEQLRSRLKERAPGTLGQKVRTEVRVVGNSIIGWAGFNPTPSRGGFRYPWALQSSGRVRYKYKSGPRQGRVTKGWFSGARSGLKKMLDSLQSETAIKIMADWRRGG